MEYRPKLHFTPEGGWMNDPNGLIYQDGVYHLFYQYNPKDTVWGPMHWGHARSADLIHWEPLPIALYPDANGMAFSGSAASVDGRIALVYTSHGETEQQSLAFGDEEGLHFTPYEGNPVIANHALRDFRDPKVFEDPERGGWSLILAAGDRALFYHSENLVEWEKTGEFGPFSLFDGCVWECPMLVRVEDRWVLITSIGMVGDKPLHDMYYWIGAWKGGRFVADSLTPEIVDFARDDYAGVTWFGAPEPTFIGWASQWAYANQLPTAAEGFRSQMTLARRLSLKPTDRGLKLAAAPIGLKPLLHICESGPFEITLSNGEEVLRLGVDVHGQLYMDRTGTHPIDGTDLFLEERYARCTASRFFTDAPCDLDLYYDRSVVEIYADGGTRVGTMLVYPERELVDIQVRSCNA